MKFEKLIEDAEFIIERMEGNIRILKKEIKKWKKLNKQKPKPKKAHGKWGRSYA